jgi:hypothetical protein
MSRLSRADTTPQISQEALRVEGGTYLAARVKFNKSSSGSSLRFVAHVRATEGKKSINFFLTNNWAILGFSSSTNAFYK